MVFVYLTLFLYQNSGEDKTLPLSVALWFYRVGFIEFIVLEPKHVIPLGYESCPFLTLP